jgi:hypothetical protein
MMPSVGTEADPSTPRPPAPTRLLSGRYGTRASDLMRSGCLTVKICMTPRRPVMQPSPSDAR